MGDPRAGVPPLLFPSPSLLTDRLLPRETRTLLPTPYLPVLPPLLLRTLSSSAKTSSPSVGGPCPLLTPPLLRRPPLPSTQSNVTPGPHTLLHVARSSSDPCDSLPVVGGICGRTLRSHRGLRSRPCFVHESLITDPPRRPFLDTRLLRPTTAGGGRWAGLYDGQGGFSTQVEP